MSNYRPRIADQLLEELLEVVGSVLVEGPKWCDKTTTSEQRANSILYMDAPDYKAQNLHIYYFCEI